MKTAGENFWEAKAESCKETPERKERLNVGEEGRSTVRCEGGGAWEEGRW